MRLKLTHFSRLFSATILWAALISLTGYNIILRQTRSFAYADKLSAVLTRPFSPAPHEQLSQALWNSGARALAKHELAITSDLSPVLGADTTTQEVREAAQAKYWEDVAANHPDYRDAFITLATIAYARGDVLQTHAYLSQAASLDPNGARVHELLRFISSLK